MTVNQAGELLGALHLFRRLAARRFISALLSSGQRTVPSVSTLDNILPRRAMQIPCMVRVMVVAARALAAFHILGVHVLG